MTSDLASYDVWLLISGEDLYPFSSHGFRFAQGSLRSVIARSKGNLFLNAEGDVFKIAKIEPIHNSLAARVKRRLGSPYGIDVELEHQPIDLSEIKERLTRGLAKYYAQAEEDESWRFATSSPASSKNAVWNAATTKQLFAILELPPASDCLDLL